MFARPTATDEAVRSISEREVFPTEMRSWALEQLPTQWKNQAFFSAGVTQVEFLTEGRELSRRIAAGEISRADARLELKQLLERTDYKPTDPGDEGTIKDLRTDRRLNLILDTQTRMARGFGQWQAGQSRAVLRAFPAQELYRGMARNVPRPWRTMWAAAGGRFFDGGKMIALKSDGIWLKSISAGGFNRFGNPWTPYDFGSGMVIRDVSRKRARDIGLVPPAVPPKGGRGNMNAGVQATPPRRPSDRLRAAAEKAGLGKWKGDTLVMTPAVQDAGGPPPVPASVAMGTPVSGAVDVRVRDRDLSDEGAAALRAIDQVHGDGVLPKVPVLKMPNGSAGGFFKALAMPSGSIVAKEMRFSAEGGFSPAHVLVHEAGHFLDMFGLHKPTRSAVYASKSSPELKDWRAAVAASTAVKSIRGGTAVKNAGYAKYLLEDEELWARSYAQFVTEESGDAKLTGYLDKVRDGKQPGMPAASQWEESDFKPIREAIRNLFVQKGWMR